MSDQLYENTNINKNAIPLQYHEEDIDNGCSPCKLCDMINYEEFGTSLAMIAGVGMALSLIHI